MKFPQSLLPLPARSDSNLAAEQLEPRVLFSAAPINVDAPTETDSADAPAQEAPAVAEAVQPPGASTPSPVDAPQAQGPAEAVPAEKDAGDISVEQEIVLVDVDASAKELNHQAKENAPGAEPEISLLLLGTDTTSVEVDSNGNLVVEDILDDDTDDKLFIGLVDGRLEVRDSRNTVGSSIADAIAVGNRGRGVSVALGSFTGDIIVRTQGGDDTITIGDLDGLPRGIIIEDGAGQDVIKQKGAVNLGSDAQVKYAAEQIRFERHSSVTTDNGAITIHGNSDETSTKRSTGVWANGSRILSSTGTIEISGVGGIKGSANRGVYLKASEVHSATGEMAINGTGGGTGNSNDGIYLARGTAISAGSNAGPTFFGEGGAAKNSNRGVYIQSGVSLSVEQGRLSISGTGGEGRSSNTGIVAGKAEITSNGPEVIQIAGHADGAGSKNMGVQMKGTSVTANGDGRISVTGLSSQPSTGSKNHAMELRSVSIIANNGEVHVAGSGGRAANASIGLRATNSTISSSYGDVTLSGVRYSSSTGSGNRGFDFSRGVISSGGDIKITGVGGKSVSHNTGARIVSTQLIAGNNATITGTARGTISEGSHNRGVEIHNSELSALTLNVKGTGGGGVHKNIGLSVHRSTLIGRTGDVLLDGQAGATTTGSNNRGTEITSSLIQAGADAVISGFSGNGINHNQGVRIVRSSVEAGPSTRISIVGTARETTSGKSNMGVFLDNRVAFKGGSLVMSGDGGGGIDLNHGIFANRNISTDTGTNAIVGTAGAGLNSENTTGDFFP